METVKEKGPQTKDNQDERMKSSQPTQFAFFLKFKSETRLTQHIQLQTPAYHSDLVTRSLFEAQPLESAVPLLLQYSQYFDYTDF